MKTSMKKSTKKKKKVATGGEARTQTTSMGARSPRAGRSFSDVKSYSRDKTPRIDEKMGVFDFKKVNKKFMTFRILDTSTEPFVSIAQVWVKKTISKEGANKEVTYPRLACNWDPFAGEFTDPRKDPYLGVGENSMSAPFYILAISRDLQERKKKWSGPKTPKEKKGYFELDADVEECMQRTPIRVLSLPGGVVSDLGTKFKQLNVVKIKDAKGKLKKVEKDLTDAKYGCDVSICYDKDAQGGKKYSIQIGQRTPLTPEELAYLKWDLEKITEANFVPTQTYEEAQAELKREFGDTEAADDYLEEDEDDSDLSKVSKKKKKKVLKMIEDHDAKKKKKKVGSTSSSSSKSKSKLKSKSVPAKSVGKAVKGNVKDAGKGKAVKGKVVAPAKKGKGKPVKSSKPAPGKKKSKKDDFEDDIPF